MTPTRQRTRTVDWVVESIADREALEPANGTGPTTFFASGGSFVLTERLGAGGMAELWLAQKSRPGGFCRNVVIKRMLPELAKDSGLAARFVREARLVAQLHHPNIVQIIDLEERAGEPLIVMEYLEGEDVRRLIHRQGQSRTSLAPPTAARIARDVADALHAVHELKNEQGQPAQIVHRDVAPDNLFLTVTGDVKLVDFGSAITVVAPRITQRGMAIGKPSYMAPEALCGETPDRSWDIYGLGACLYEMLTGQPPHSLSDAASEDPELMGRQIEAMVERSPLPLQKLRPGLPASLCSVVMTALAKKPSKRFRTAGEMKEALDECLSQIGCPRRQALARLLTEEPNEPSHPPVAQPREVGHRRIPRWALLGLGLLVLLAGVLVLREVWPRS